MFRYGASVAMVATLLAGCGGADGAAARRPDREFGDGAPSQPQPAAQTQLLVVLGTSLTAGLGLPPEQAYPALLQRRLDSLGLRYEVVNAGVSGETSAGARRRAEWLFRRKPDVLVVETGANDGLRGQAPDSLRANLVAIIAAARAANPSVRILLAGMEAPRNWGRSYASRFQAVYPEVGEAEDVAVSPFLLDGVAAVPGLNLADGIHPNAAGHRRALENLWPSLEPLLR
jgi:acyl-CoA thioesterase-1